MDRDSLKIRQYYFYDTKRTVFIKDNKIEFRNTISMGDAKIGKVNNVSIYEKAQLPKNIKDYTNKIIEMAHNIGSKYKKKLVVKQIATSYGYVNGNYRYYHPDSIKQNAKTFYTPNPVPVIFDHNRYSASEVGGRVMFAHPIKYDVDKSAINDLRVPKMAIVTYSLITERNMVEGIMDSRYLQISSGFGVNRNTATCSICGATISEGCEHYRGEVYDGKLAYLICHDMKYSDLSYVLNPADEWSKNITWEEVDDDDIISIDNKNKSNTDKYVDEIGIDDPVSLFLIDDNDPKQWMDMRDFNSKKIEDIMGNNYVCDGNVCELITDYMGKTEEFILGDSENNNISNNDNMDDKLKDNNELKNDNKKENEYALKNSKNNSNEYQNNDTKNDNNTNIKIEEQQNDSEDEYMINAIATLHIVEDLLENNAITVSDAIATLKDGNVVTLFDSENIDKAKLLKLIQDYLDYIGDKDISITYNDKKLSTKERKKLPDSVFCGPGRTFPIPDCCLVYDTEIPLMNGNTVKIGELAEKEEYANKNDLYVYGFDLKSKSIVPAKISKVWKAIENAPLLRITLDNNESVVCTYNHPFLLRDGKYVRADELKVGMSLMPLNFKSSFEFDIKKYGKVYQPWYNYWEFIHHMSARYQENRPIPDNCVVHHKDHNAENNNPTNLEYIDKIEHLKMHTNDRKNMKHNISDTERELKSKFMKNRMKKILSDEQLSMEHSRRISIGRRTYDLDNPYAKINNTKYNLIEINVARKNGVRLSFLSSILGVSTTTLSRWIKYFNKRFSVVIGDINNNVRELVISYFHSVFNADLSEMYKEFQHGSSYSALSKKYKIDRNTIRQWFEHAGYKTNKIDARLELHDMDINKVAQIIYSGKSSFTEISNLINVNSDTLSKYVQSQLPYNHKVVKIEFAGYGDAYDMEIPSTHNFGLKAGVFVHNSHVTAARRLIGRTKYSEATKKKILACVNRKAKALGCDKGNKKSKK